jgi:hypothetical protein
LTPKKHQIYTSSPITSISSKITRLSSPLSDVEESVPSSQSGEQEMGVKQNVDKLRKKTLSPSAGDLLLTSQGNAENAQMDIDVVTLAAGSNSSFLEFKPDRPTTPSPTATSVQLFLPATPVHLNAASKTAQLIAQIKEKAYAASLSSPESMASVDFNEELVESSDEADVELWKPLSTAKGAKYVSLLF